MSNLPTFISIESIYAGLDYGHYYQGPDRYQTHLTEIQGPWAKGGAKASANSLPQPPPGATLKDTQGGGWHG